METTRRPSWGVIALTLGLLAAIVWGLQPFITL
jgi:cbb3-type cytochrome oxidase subunit 3